MQASQLEAILGNETARTSLSYRSPVDLTQRFESLRASGLLPKGRGQKLRPLSISEITAAILCIATDKPGFAGLVSKVLMDLHPVGGTAASFVGAPTFGGALLAIFESAQAIKSLLEVRISDSEIYKNGHCRAAITYRCPEGERTAHYVGKLAVSLLQSGAEKNFDQRELNSSVITETVFYPRFFRRIVRELKDEAQRPPAIAATDVEEEDEEIRKTVRAQRLGLTLHSDFLNVGVDNQVTWPHEETVASFDGKKLILLPKTKDHATSIHVDLHGQKLSQEAALTLINRFLSVLTWCNDQFAVVQDGWSGNPVPVPVPKRDLAFSTAYQWVFDRKSPESLEARKAIAIYRDARNAEQNYLVSYAVLSYYKIIELKHRGRGPVKKWYQDKFEALRQDRTLVDELKAFTVACGNQSPSDYLYDACRVAVAHANTPYSSDPDDVHELRRLHIAAAILRPLVRRFIEKELNVSDCVYDGT